MQGEAGEEAGSFLAAAAAAAAAAGSVAHQCSLTPCRTSSAPPQVVACGEEVSWPTVAQGAAGGGAAHYCCCNHKETCPSFVSAPGLPPGSSQQEKEHLGQVGHAVDGVSWLPFVHPSVRSSYLQDQDQDHGLLQPHHVDPCFYFQVGKH